MTVIVYFRDGTFRVVEHVWKIQDATQSVELVLYNHIEKRYTNVVKVEAVEM
jgi:hypothetical protein